MSHLIHQQLFVYKGNYLAYDLRGLQLLLDRPDNGQPGYARAPGMDMPAMRHKKPGSRDRRIAVLPLLEFFKLSQLV